MQEFYKILKWDTDFFGFVVAKICPHSLRDQTLIHTLEGLRKNNVKLVYWASDPQDEASQKLARALGGTFVDQKVTYFINLDCEYKSNLAITSEIKVFDGNWPNKDLTNLAIESGLHSRFKVDPKIPKEKFEELYTIWIRESVKRNIADSVLVWEDCGRIVGMITVAIKNKRGDIGLIAVDESVRGKRIGEKLVYSALKWAQSKGYMTNQVVTQGNNRAACRLYEKCGYEIEKIQNYYHFWLQD